MLQVLRILAFPISLLYAIVVFVRNLFYDFGWFKSHTSQLPTLCVGNLSVGGTGKTPMIEYLVELLTDIPLAVLSRGYKRTSKGLLMAKDTSTVEDLGDEPYQIHTKFPEVTVAVCADRVAGVKALEKQTQAKLILLDDAFQHRRIQPTSSILLTTYAKPYVSDWYLPTGDLRDNKVAAKRTDSIVVTKCPENISSEERKSLTEKLGPLPHQKVLFCWFSYAEKPENREGTQLEWDQLSSKKVGVVTGIANPTPFLQHLKSQAFPFEHLDFPDHHAFTDLELARFQEYDYIITTEKDYVRLEGRLKNAFYLSVKHTFSQEDTAYLEKTVKQLLD
ncbi:MAG: tetraacyldisaccharide 4'-kinase [Bacteroidota bacterium]